MPASSNLETGGSIPLVVLWLSVRIKFRLRLHIPYYIPTSKDSFLQALLIDQEIKVISFQAQVVPTKGKYITLLYVLYVFAF